MFTISFNILKNQSRLMPNISQSAILVLHHLFHLVVSDLAVVFAQRFELFRELEATISDAVKARGATELLQRWVLDNDFFPGQLAWIEEAGLYKS